MSFFSRNIFDSSDRAFGLDLSDLSLKAVLIGKDGSREFIESFSSVSLPAGAVVDGEILKREVVVDALKTLIEKSGPKHLGVRQVVCSLPEVKAFLRIINMPVMDEEEAREAVRWEIESNIPLTLDQIYYDCQVLDKNLAKKQETKQSTMSVLVVAIVKDVVDQFISVLEEVGLEVVGLETESIAEARSLLPKKKTGQTSLIIDIGDRRTGFLIAIDNTPCFTSSIPLSSQMVTDAISKTLKISNDEAENIKLTYGIGSPLKKDPLFRSVQPVVESLVVETERFIEFYLNDLAYSSSVDKIVLCGGGSAMKGLFAYLSQRLHIPAELGDPWMNINLAGRLPIIEKKQSIQYSTAIGLALKKTKI